MKIILSYYLSSFVYKSGKIFSFFEELEDAVNLWIQYEAVLDVFDYPSGVQTDPVNRGDRHRLIRQNASGSAGDMMQAIFDDLN